GVAGARPRRRDPLAAAAHGVGLRRIPARADRAVHRHGERSVGGRRAALRVHARRRAPLGVSQAGPALGHDRLLEAAARALVTDFHEIAERDHVIQNPTSEDKIRLLGEYIRLGPESRVLDIACGKGAPATILASTFGCSIVGVEIRDPFASEARARIAAAGLDGLVEVHTADAKAFPVEPESFDAALCLGATFVWGEMQHAAP